MINADKLIQANNLDENPGLIPKKVSFIMRKINTPTIRTGRKSKLIEEITKTNERLGKDLDNLKSTTNCLKDIEQFKNVTSLVNELTDLEHQVVTEKCYLEDLEQQIRKLENIKKRTTKRLGGKYKATQIGDVKELDKSRERWQDKLQVESVHLGNEITKNKELREKIRCMMSERSKFNKDYDDLLEKLKSGKKIMKDVVECVKLAEGQRKNILTKIETINFQEQKQIALQEEEAYILKMRKVHEHELNKFYTTKQRERPSVASEQERARSRHLTDETVLNNYRNVLLEIVEKSGEPRESMGFDSIVNQFKNSESEILSLFKYATHLNHEMEVLKDKLAEQGKQINEMTSDQDMKTIRHEDELKYLISLKEKIGEENLISKDNIKGTERLLARLYEGVENLIRTTKADISPLLLLLGENEKVTAFNYTLFMEALETKLIEIMNLIPLSSHTLPSLISSTKLTNVSKGKSGTIRQPDESFQTKIVITSPCQECATYKKEIEELLRPVRDGVKVKVY